MQGNGGPERLSTLSEIIQLESGGAKIQIQGSCALSIAPHALSIYVRYFKKLLLVSLLYSRP